MPQRGLCPRAAQMAAVGDWEPSWVPTDGSFPWLITQAALRGDILRPSRAYSAFSGLYSSFHYFSPNRVAKIRLICTLRKQKRWKSACCPDMESLSPLMLHSWQSGNGPGATCGSGTSDASQKSTRSHIFPLGQTTNLHRALLLYRGQHENQSNSLKSNQPRTCTHTRLQLCNPQPWPQDHTFFTRCQDRGWKGSGSGQAEQRSPGAGSAVAVLGSQQAGGWRGCRVPVLQLKGHIRQSLSKLWGGLKCSSVLKNLQGMHSIPLAEITAYFTAGS